jgi:hypothetical protein
MATATVKWGSIADLFDPRLDTPFRSLVEDLATLTRSDPTRFQVPAIDDDPLPGEDGQYAGAWNEVMTVEDLEGILCSLSDICEGREPTDPQAKWGMKLAQLIAYTTLSGAEPQANGPGSLLDIWLQSASVEVAGERQYCGDWAYDVRWGDWVQIMKSATEAALGQEPTGPQARWGMRAYAFVWHFSRYKAPEEPVDLTDESPAEPDRVVLDFEEPPPPAAERIVLDLPDPAAPSETPAPPQVRQDKKSGLITRARAWINHAWETHFRS